MGDAKGQAYYALPGDGKDPSKVSLLDELLDLLRRMLDALLCCLTCGCYPGPRNNLHAEVYDVELMEEEKQAVQHLLAYLDSGEMKKAPCVNEERLRALCILSYSSSDDLQRSAALCFAELSDKMRTPVTAEMLEPLIVLLKSRDKQVQKAASLSVSNFALNGPVENRSVIVQSGALPPLIELLSSSNVEVVCNACGCLTTLATKDEYKQAIVDAGGLEPILSLAASTSDFRVQRNACGALLNLTHLQSIRAKLVEEGSLPVLVEALQSSDADVQYYTAAALSNLAVNERHRAMMVAIGHYDVIKRLLVLLKSKYKKVRYQSCLALRNLASDEDNQVLIVKLKGLPKLHDLMKAADGEVLTAAVACLRNLSIHKANEAGIIGETFLSELRRLVLNHPNPETQVHAAGTIRNLAAGEEIQRFLDTMKSPMEASIKELTELLGCKETLSTGKRMTRSGCVESLIEVLLSEKTSTRVVSEVTAALAVLADEDITKHRLLMTAEGKAFARLINLAINSPELEVRYNCAGTIGQLALTEIPTVTLARCKPDLLNYLDTQLHSDDDSFVHIALWTLMQLLNNPGIKSSVQSHNLYASVEKLADSAHSSTIKELAETIQRKLKPES